MGEVKKGGGRRGGWEGGDTERVGGVLGVVIGGAVNKRFGAGGGGGGEGFSSGRREGGQGEGVGGVGVGEGGTGWVYGGPAASSVVSWRASFLGE